MDNDVRQWTGMWLAIGGNLLISVALNLTKHAHNVNQACAAPQPYTRLPLWWCGFALTLLGECGKDPKRMAAMCNCPCKPDQCSVSG